MPGRPSEFDFSDQFLPPEWSDESLLVLVGTQNLTEDTCVGSASSHTNSEPEIHVCPPECHGRSMSICMQMYVNTCMYKYTYA